MKSKPRLLIYPESSDEIEKMLLGLKDEGEENAFSYVKNRLKK